MDKSKKIFIIGIICFIVSAGINILSGNIPMAAVFFILSLVLIIKLVLGK